MLRHAHDAPRRGRGRRSWGCARAPATSYITIGTDAIGTVRALAAADHAPLDVLEVGDAAAVVAIDTRELAALSERMHREFDRCGGFIVHDSLDDARAAIVHKEKRPIEYTLDRAAACSAVLPALDEQRILGTIRELSAMPNRYYQSTPARLRRRGCAIAGGASRIART